MYLLKVRIRSEHGIGWPKGRFQSLRGLRVSIKDRKGHHFACAWVVGCIAVHSFAVLEELRSHEGLAKIPDDPFVDEGLSSSSGSSHVAPVWRGRGRPRPMTAGEERREKMKRALFRHLGEHVLPEDDAGYVAARGDEDDEMSVDE